MTNKLYVANVPLDATEDALRRHFASAGGVADVEILRDRQSGRSRGLASVTMTSSSFLAAALSRLNGVAFDGAILRVSDAPVRADAEARPAVKIVLQFRERASMVDARLHRAILSHAREPDARHLISARMLLTQTLEAFPRERMVNQSLTPLDHN